MKPILSYNQQDRLEVGNGKQLFGYAGIFGQEGQTTGYPCHQVSLVDQRYYTRYITVDEQAYAEMSEQFERLNLQNTESLYLWLEQANDGTVIHWRLFKSNLSLEQIYPIYQACYDFESLYQLFDLIENLKMMPLKSFAREVLMDTQLMTAFVSIPASKQHHHSFPGGLLMHSLECALMTQQNVGSLIDISNNEKEVTVIAALFHDIGKIKTLGSHQHTSIGRLIDHEQFTLMMLAEPLSRLETVWAQGAEALQYLLTWTEKQGNCRFVSGNVIKMADRLSTSASLNSMAFKDKPDYYHFSELSIGANKQYLNRLN